LSIIVCSFGLFCWGSLSFAFAQKNPYLQKCCLKIIKEKERLFGIPEDLLRAIAETESGQRGSDGKMKICPWTVNIKGKGFYFKTQKEALTFVQSYIKKTRSFNIDVGPMQINLHYHRSGFRSIQDALDPVKNIHYAALFLSQLAEKTKGRWYQAAAHYHSLNPEFHIVYQKKILRKLQRIKQERIYTIYPQKRPQAPFLNRRT